MIKHYIDLTHKITNNTPTFPGDNTFKLTQHKTLKNDHYNDSFLETSMHVGTHMDAPSHMIKSNTFVSDYTFEQLIGKAVVLDVRNQQAITYHKSYESLIKEGTIVLLYTGHDQFFNKPTYFTQYPKLTNDFTNLLIKKKIKLLGLDSPSPDYAPYKIHKKLLRENIGIIENLTNLEKLLSYNTIKLFVIPLKIASSGGFTRVFAEVNKN
ncbi:MAG: cyclase family protein [Halanaerobiales bacterium]|nr:cyclase family protein [Halanaerobiales bacterium]